MVSHHSNNAIPVIKIRPVWFPGLSQYRRAVRPRFEAVRVFLALMAVAIGVVLSSVDSAAELRPVVYTVNYPLHYFARRIAGNRLKVVFPAPKRIDPAFWVPEPKVIVGYQDADLILVNGAGYAKWRVVVSVPRRSIVDTSAAFRKSFIPIARVSHTHGPTGKHSHGAVAFTTWLDFNQAARQSKAIAAAFAKRWPRARQSFETNLAGLSADLRALDLRMGALSAGKPDLPLIASHLVYQYFARRYRLNLKSVQWEPDEVPNPDQWAKLAALRKTHQAGWMIWEGPPKAETVARLEGLGVRSVVFEPAGNVPEDGDFIAVMKRNISNLETVFR